MLRARADSSTQSEAFAAYCKDRSRIPNPMRVTGEESKEKKILEGDRASS